MPNLLSFLGVPVQQQNLVNEPILLEEPSEFKPHVFRVALANIKSEEVLEKYLDKQAKLYPNEYREAIQAYFKEKLANRTGLMRHVSFFDSENRSTLNFGTVVQGFKDLGFEPLSAYLNTFIVIGGAIAGTKKIDRPVEEAHNLTHPKSHTAVFNQNVDNLNQDVHEARMRSMIKQIMNGREVLEQEDIDSLVEQLGKKRSKTCTDELIRALLRPLQRVAFTNLMNLCGGVLTEQNLNDFFRGTLFYAVAEPSSIAHRVMTMR
ncbi:caleosin family protein [Legionella bononiensis]|uniref:Uncharacterized protein n=1 Tax=Legionella bononiensis TaxID=2793102 RepID=A0ABS1WA09_9GAMM|nr:caleosin family protein [Legionella bononiensis]MBL7480617.1 hypothetical protein [Legionella bononiensis]MBL7526184.1 hypothetical protein [Legionella bononiensis]MBL7563321.1 hypothetical protein [Legionella bononiensis]